MTDDLTPEATRALYDTVAESYAEMLPDTSAEDGLDLAMVAALVTRVAHPSARILDAGCGTGRMTAHLTGSGLGVWGLDLSPRMIDIARARHPETLFAVGELQALPYQDLAFDGVLAWYSIIHTPPTQLPMIFDEFRRVLQPRGHLLLGFQSGRGGRRVPGAYGHEVVLHAQLHEPDRIAEQLRAARLEVVATLTRAPVRERHPQAFVLARRL